MHSNSVAARTQRARREAERQGYLLVKSRRRNPNADDYGLFVLVADSRGNRVGRRGGQAAVSAFLRGDGLTLDGVEAALRN
ncbi:hypothetical protein ABZ413_29465 [Nocardia rhamnosiphila]|uniref:hypothetical protein n=1 Tax=Nocardia rhamnosiphila TaxID=426716 RepID=UPI0034029309